MDKESILLDLIKDTRQAIRDIQARIYNLSTTFVVFSFAVTAFAWKEARSLTVQITLFSDAVIAAVLVYLFLRISAEYKLVRLTVEKQESTLIRLLDGAKIPCQDLVAPLVNMNDAPAFSITREAGLFLWSAGIVLLKASLVVLSRKWFPI